MESYNKNEKPISSSSSVTIRIIKVNKSLKMAGLVTIFYCWVRLGNQGLSRDQNFPVNTREIHPFSHQSHKFIAYFDLNFVALLFCAMTAKSKILVLGGTGYIGKAYSTKKVKIRRAIEAEGIPYTYISSNAFAGYFLPNLLHQNVTAPPRDKVVIPGD